MKLSRLALLMALGGLFSGCAYVPPQENTMRRVSPDYTATGKSGVAAFMYGNVTLLQFDTEPIFLLVRDEKGASIEYERVGDYYRLPKLFDNFTVWINGRSVTFNANMATKIFSSSKRAEPAQIKAAFNQPTVAPVNTDAVKVSLSDNSHLAGDDDVIALLKLCEEQIKEARSLLDAASNDSKTTGEELFKINEKLDLVENRLVSAAAAIVQVSFPTGSTSFKPSPKVAQVIIASSKQAERINVRGRTDSKVAGSLDAKIALGRALAARKYLVDHGISAEKIRIFSQAEGDFNAPNNTKQGRALNRRVEIEFINSRIAELKGQSVKLAANTTNEKR